MNGTPRAIDRRLSAAACVVLAALALVFGVQTWGRAMRVHGNDFTSYLLAARALWQGANPYTIDTPFPFIYPLFLCVVLWPLTHIPYAVAVLVWFVVAILSLALTIRLVGSLQGSGGSLLVAVAMVCLLLADILQNNLLNGQVNFLVLACCAVFAWCWQRGHHSWASVSLAAAIALKITPAILLLFLARRREWRRLAETVTFTVVFAFALPWIVTGSRILGDYRHYTRTFLGGRLTGTTADVTEVPFSAVAMVRSVFAVSSSLDLVMIAGSLAATLLLVDRGARDAGQTALGVCLYLAAAPLITPMSEVHHLAYLLPGLILLASRGLDGFASPLLSAGTAAVLLALVVMRYVPGAGFGAVVGTCVLLAAAARGHAGPGRIACAPSLR